MIVVGGIMRSGKSLFSSQLARRKGFSCISTDYFILLLRDLFPESGIGEPGKKYHELCDGFRPFCIKLIDRLREDEYQDYIIEGYYIRPRDIVGKIDANHALFFGYPEIAPEEKFTQVRDYGKRHACYTNDIADEKLFAYVKQWIAESKELRQECLVHGFRFVDMSSQFQSKFDTLFDHFSSNTEEQRYGQHD